LGTLGPTPLGRGTVDDLETCYFPACVIVPNFVAVGQTVWAQVEGVPKYFWDAGCPTL